MSDHPINLELVYRARQKNYGSVELRVFQLARIIEHHTKGAVSVKLVTYPSKWWIRQLIWATTRPKCSVLLFSKSCLKILKPSILALCKRRGCRTIMDYVDGDLDNARDLALDIHLACSFEAKEELERIISEKNVGVGENVGLLHHNTDTRLEHAQVKPAERLLPVYIGDLANTVYGSELDGLVRYVPFERATEISDVEKVIEETNFHICVRNPNAKYKGNVRKPFTKGFLAAHVGAPVLAWRGDVEAHRFLGEDYPYYVDEPTPEAIVKAIDFAKQSFGGPVWARALNRMEVIRQQVSNQQIAMSLLALLTKGEAQD